MARVGLFEAAEGSVCLGSHDAIHARLDIEGLVFFKLMTDGAAIRMQPFDEFRWAEIESVSIDARSRTRRPSRTAFAAFSFLLEFVGFGAWLDSSDVIVTLRRRDGEEVRHECTGFLGRGYWWADLHAARSTLRELVSNKVDRELLADPLAFLDHVRTRAAEAARSGVVSHE